MMKKIIAVVLAVWALSFMSCRHAPQLENAPTVSFQNDIQPILSGNCSQSNCHGATDFRKFSVSTYDDVISSGYVTPGNARGSQLYLDVIGSGGRIMPPSSQPSLSDNQIILIYLWIEQGAKDN